MEKIWHDKHIMRLNVAFIILFVLCLFNTQLETHDHAQHKQPDVEPTLLTEQHAELHTNEVYDE